MLEVILFSFLFHLHHRLLVQNFNKQYKLWQ
jgi:hypothetical protein